MNAGITTLLEMLLIGTGDHDAPEIIEQFELPRCWERRAANKPLEPTR